MCSSDLSLLQWLIDDGPPPRNPVLSAVQGSMVRLVSPSQHFYMLDKAVGKLGQGGFGSVYQAREETGITVAVKLIDVEKRNERVSFILKPHCFPAISLNTLLKSHSKLVLAFMYFCQSMTSQRPHGTSKAASVIKTRL